MEANEQLPKFKISTSVTIGSDDQVEIRLEIGRLRASRGDREVYGDYYSATIAYLSLEEALEARAQLDHALERAISACNVKRYTA